MQQTTDQSDDGTVRDTMKKFGDCAECLGNVLKGGDWVIDEPTGRILHFECAPDPDEDSLREERSESTGE